MGHKLLTLYTKVKCAFRMTLESLHFICSNIKISQILPKYSFWLNRKLKKLEQFINRYPNSGLRDDAFYELGNTYVKSRNIAKPICYYDFFPDSKEKHNLLEVQSYCVLDSIQVDLDRNLAYKFRLD